MRKLKAKLAHTTAEADRQMIIAKIKRLSPDWDPSVVLSRADQ
jgi:hypothetical protein